MIRKKEIDAASFYFDWLNNYLTVARIAEDYQISEKRAEWLIEYGRLVWSRKQFAK